MADNVDEEHLQNQATNQSENPSEEITPTKDTETISQNQETENLEVHKHPHHVTHKKKWGKYLLEFLMLFFAVFLGFIAENIREHYAENVKVKEYAQSLYDDLKVDTATIQRTINEKIWINLKFDSAAQILASGDLIKNNEFIYYVERYITFNDVFSSQDVTYVQLRSSGNFIYIRNIALYKSIADYYNLYTRYEQIDGKFGIINQNELSEIEAKLFNIKDLTSLDNKKPTSFYNIALPSERKLELIVNDKATQNLLSIKIANVYRRNYSSVILLGWLKSNATNLIVELEKEYNLK